MPLDDQKHSYGIKANFTEQQKYDILRDMEGKTSNPSEHLHKITMVHLHGHKYLLGNKDFSHLSRQKNIPLSELLDGREISLSERQIVLLNMLSVKKGITFDEQLIMAFEEYLEGHIDRLNQLEALYNGSLS